MEMDDLVTSRWTTIQQLADGHGVAEIQWWPSSWGIDQSADFLVEGKVGSLRQLRQDLERELGCQVGIYLAPLEAVEIPDRA
ncbi:MAG: hypothetical protein ACREN8_04440 [Candidatus Dormibacteraceae bacterium]